MSTKMITAWIDGAVQEIEVPVTEEVVSAPTFEDRIVVLESKSAATDTITLSADAWVGETTPWSQVVEVDGVTPYSKIDLQPTPEVIYDLQEKKITLTAVNDTGVITVYALATKPTSDYTIQVVRTEITL